MKSLDLLKSKERLGKMSQKPRQETISIDILQEGACLKAVVGDYYTIQDYLEKMNEIDNIEICEETANRVLTFENSKYQYFRCLHDKNGSSYACGYYKPNDVPLLRLTRDEFLADFKSVIKNLSSFEGIDNIVDLSSLENIVTQPTSENTLNK